MTHLKALVSVSLLTLSVGSTTALYAAPNDTAVATADSVANNSSPTNTLENRSVDDLVAIAKAGENNDAINDAVLGNDAINPAADREESSATSSAPTPMTSNAPSIDADKLILNEPVIDQANILSSAQKQQLTNQLQSIYRQGLAQAALVIVPTTNGVPIFD